MQRLWTALQRRAWSRAGAVAAVVSSRPARRAGTFAARLSILLFGSSLVAISVALTLWTGLGPGPLDVFIGAIRNMTGAPLTLAVWGTVGAIIAIACALGRRPGIGTFISPFAIGPILQAAAEVLDRIDAPSSLAVRIAVQLVAIAGIDIGSGALIVSGLGAGSGELFAAATSDRVHKSETTVRFWTEITWIAVGVALGGPAGRGTIMVAALIGPAVHHGYQLVDAGVGGIAGTRRAPIVEPELVSSAA